MKIFVFNSRSIQLSQDNFPTLKFLAMFEILNFASSRDVHKFRGLPKGVCSEAILHLSHDNGYDTLQ